jgi:hypothetical protein
LAESLIFPHIRPARVYRPCGRLDQRAFCSASDQSNSAEDFSVALSVPRKALAALTIAAVAVEPVDELAVVLAAVLAAALAVAVAESPSLSDEAQPPATLASASATPTAIEADLFRVTFMIPFHERDLRRETLEGKRIFATSPRLRKRTEWHSHDIQPPVIDQCHGSDGRFTKPYSSACAPAT